ncbi:YuzL family protein [Lottiidibacillus patelloidae]|nr:YuzL family protein [Lottiidibacillus patelloidae]
MGKTKRNPSPEGVGAASVQGKKTRGFTAEYQSGYQGQGRSSNQQYKKK